MMKSILGLGLSDEAADDLAQAGLQCDRLDGQAVGAPLLSAFAQAERVLIDTTRIPDAVIEQLCHAPRADGNPFQVCLALTRRVRDLNRRPVDNWFWIPRNLSSARLSWFFTQGLRQLERQDEIRFRQSVSRKLGLVYDDLAPQDSFAHDDTSRVLAYGSYPDGLAAGDDTLEIITAMTPDQVSDLAANQNFDCLLFSESSGENVIEVLRRLKQDVRHITRPVIVLSDTGDITPDEGLDIFPCAISASDLSAVIALLSRRFQIEQRLARSLEVLSALPGQTTRADTFFHAYLEHCLSEETNLSLCRFAIRPHMPDLDPETTDWAIVSQCLGMIPLLTRTIDLPFIRLTDQDVLLAIRNRQPANLDVMARRLYSILQASLSSMLTEDRQSQHIIEETYATAMPGDTPDTLMGRVMTVGASDAS